MSFNMFDQGNYDNSQNYQNNMYPNYPNYNNQYQNNYYQNGQYPNNYTGNYDIMTDNDSFQEKESFTYLDFQISMLLFLLPVIGIFVSVSFLKDDFASQTKRNFAKAGIVISVIMTLLVSTVSYLLIFKESQKEPAVTTQATATTTEKKNEKQESKALLASDIQMAGKTLNTYSITDFVAKYSLTVTSVSNGTGGALDAKNWAKIKFSADDLIIYFDCNDASGNTYTLTCTGKKDEIIATKMVRSLNAKNLAGNIGLEMNQIPCSTATPTQLAATYGNNQAVGDTSYQTSFVQSDGSKWSIRAVFSEETKMMTELNIYAN